MPCMDATRPCHPAVPLLLHNGGQAIPNTPHSSLLSLSALTHPSLALKLTNAEHVHHGHPWSFVVPLLQATAAASARTTASISSPSIPHARSHGPLDTEVTPPLPQRLHVSGVRGQHAAGHHRRGRGHLWMRGDPVVLPRPSVAVDEPPPAGIDELPTTPLC
jgi:hypothetical protein